MAATSAIVSDATLFLGALEERLSKHSDAVSVEDSILMSQVSTVSEVPVETPAESKSTVSSVCVPALDVQSIKSVSECTTVSSTPRDVPSGQSTVASTPRDVASTVASTPRDAQTPSVEQGFNAAGVRAYHAKLWAHGASVIERQIALNILPSDFAGDQSDDLSVSEISVTSCENESWKNSKSRKPIAEMTSAEKWLNMA
jgi:hypothetical protein